MHSNAFRQQNQTKAVNNKYPQNQIENEKLKKMKITVAK